MIDIVSPKKALNEYLSCLLMMTTHWRLVQSIAL
ncbi:hypothetical protein L861_22550 [Litchfieldella anticariensis FP35 = DSM 16096]|uniref:Uncharacterized protein n=1 Tax=Litchfieldella anticariensis (strain DSM 16096 / CECT 5854 / CIP 108499 / LMG 22089 / FP35) TaxID=1121939 RepID=S2KRH0_LITA3|nr:hypothetical protein L861_22550 [Halomonas anticariensis FP35 = DSM 16096]